MSRTIEVSNVEDLLRLNPDDITKKLLIRMFAHTSNSDPVFKMDQKITIPKEKFNTKAPINTTVGRYIFNLFLTSPFFEHMEFVNKPVTKKVYEEINDTLSELLLMKKINTTEYINYLNKIEWLGFGCSDFISPSFNVEILKPLSKVIDKRKTLIDQHKEDIEKGNAIVSTVIETELKDLARNELKDNPAMDLYNSGAKMSFDNNYKNSMIMKGAVKDNATGQFNVITNSYMEGVKVNDYANFADTLVYAAYQSGVATRESGYNTKKFFSAFQSVILDDKDSDCGTQKTLTFKITKSNSYAFTYRFIKEGGKLIRLEPDVLKKYIGKIVELRTVLFCLSDKICNKCAGDLYYLLEIENIGLTTTKVTTSLMNLSLKARHDITTNIHKIEVAKYME